MTTLQELKEHRKRHVPRGLFHISQYALAGGHGAECWDAEGKQFIDFASGVGVLNTGHTPGPVVQAIVDQAARYIHSCFNLMMYEPYVQLAERLNGLMPVAEPAKTFLVNSGTEAVEHAVKMARYFTGRTDVITFHFGYHGRTLLASTMTGRIRSYRTGFGPGVPGVHRAPYPYCYRCPLDCSPDSCRTACFRLLEELFVHTVAEKDVAAVVMEPILGEGGVVVPPREYLHKLVDFCRERSILLIMDEVQSGIGRTGYWTACHHFGLRPDIILTAKALASGLPIGSVTGRAEVMDSPPPGGIGGTFCGNPVSCAAALATLDMIEDQNLLERASAIGNRLQTVLETWKSNYELIGDVRGIGAWAALELVEDRASKRPAAKTATAVLKRCHEKGLMTLFAGPFSNVIRLLPPLVITDEQIDRGLTILREAIEEAVQAGGQSR